MSASPCTQSVSMTHFHWLKIVTTTAWNHAPFGQKMVKHIVMKNWQIDWITYIRRTVSSDQVWVCLHLAILPPPEALSALPSNIHLFPPSGRTLLETDEASSQQNTKVYIFTFNKQHGPDVHLINQSMWFTFSFKAESCKNIIYYTFSKQMCSVTPCIVSHTLRTWQCTSFGMALPKAAPLPPLRMLYNVWWHN